MEQNGGADPNPRHHREQVIEALKTAFAQGRLDKGEFDQRVGQALAAYAELDELAAGIPAARPTVPTADRAAAAEPQVTREAYNRGLVARGTIVAAGGVGLIAAIAVTVGTGNLLAGFIAGGALSAFLAVILGTILTLILWLMESSGGRSARRSRRTPPPQARSGVTERLASAEQADPPDLPRRDGRHTAEAIRQRRHARTQAIPKLSM
jgi:hypothetical protein